MTQLLGTLMIVYLLGYIITAIKLSENNVDMFATASMLLLALFWPFFIFNKKDKS